MILLFLVVLLLALKRFTLKRNLKGYGERHTLFNYLDMNTTDVSFISNLISRVFVMSRFGCSMFCVQAKLKFFSI